MDPGDSMMMMGSQPARLADDGTFEMKSGPGRMRISMMGMMNGFVVRAVRLNGIDITTPGSSSSQARTSAASKSN